VNLLSSVLAAALATVFNYVPGVRSPLDEQAHAHFGKSYKVIDVGERERLVFPKGQGPVSPDPVYVRGRCLEGEVTVLYIIDAQGAVVSPHVARTDNAILSGPALAKMKAQRFEPAKVDGKPAAMLAVTRLQFRCPAGSRT
jgi:hypothetical protein